MMAMAQEFTWNHGPTLIRYWSLEPSMILDSSTFEMSYFALVTVCHNVLLRSSTTIRLERFGT